MSCMPSLKMMCSVFDAAAIELRAIDQMPHEGVEEDRAHQNEGDPRERLHHQVEHDAMLQQDLRGPLLVRRRELLLRLDAVVVDAENLAERAPPFQVRQSRGLVHPGSRGRCGLELVAEGLMCGGESGDIGARLPQGLLHQIVAGALVEPAR